MSQISIKLIVTVVFAFPSQILKTYHNSLFHFQSLFERYSSFATLPRSFLSATVPSLGFIRIVLFAFNVTASLYMSLSLPFAVLNAAVQATSPFRAATSQTLPSLLLPIY